MKFRKLVVQQLEEVGLQQTSLVGCRCRGGGGGSSAPLACRDVLGNPSMTSPTPSFCSGSKMTSSSRSPISWSGIS